MIERARGSVICAALFGGMVVCHGGLSGGREGPSHQREYRSTCVTATQTRQSAQTTVKGNAQQLSVHTLNRWHQRLLERCDWMGLEVWYSGVVSRKSARGMPDEHSDLTWQVIDKEGLVAFELSVWLKRRPDTAVVVAVEGTRLYITLNYVAPEFGRAHVATLDNQSVGEFLDDLNTMQSPPQKDGGQPSEDGGGFF